MLARLPHHASSRARLAALVTTALALVGCSGTVDTGARTLRPEWSGGLEEGWRLVAFAALDGGSVAAALVEESSAHEPRRTLARIGADGRVEWSLAFQEGGYEVRLARGPGGDVFVEGPVGAHEENGLVTGGLKLEAFALESPFVGDRFLMRLSADGSVRWGKVYSTLDPSVATVGLLPRAFAPAGDGFLLGGTFVSSADLDGTKLVAPTPGDAPAFVARFDGTGKRVRSTTFGTAATVTSLAEAPDGGALVAGTFSNVVTLGGKPLSAGPSGAMLLARLGPTNEAVWSRHFVSEAVPEIHAWGDGAAVAASGSAIDLGVGTWLDGVAAARVEADGTITWARRVASSPAAGGPLVTVEPDGRLVALLALRPPSTETYPPYDPYQPIERTLVAISRTGTLDASLAFDSVAAPQYPGFFGLDAEPSGGIVAASSITTYLDGQEPLEHTSFQGLRLAPEE